MAEVLEGGGAALPRELMPSGDSMGTPPPNGFQAWLASVQPAHRHVHMPHACTLQDSPPLY